MATNIYDALAGQSALDVFHEGVYPTGDPETRGGMYSRAKGYGGLIHLVNQYLDNQGLEPTQENYDMAFRALGAGAPVPVAAKVPEGESAMTSYFDRLLGRTPETKKKTETLQEIMLEDESSEPDLDPSPYPYDPTDWRDITREEHDLYTSYGPLDFFGKALGIPGEFGASAKENEAKAKKTQEILENIYTAEVVADWNKQKKDQGSKFSLEGLLDKAVQSLFGFTDPAAALYDKEGEIAMTKGLSKAVGLEGLGLIGDETFLDIGPEEAQLNKEQAAARVGVSPAVYDQLMSQTQFDGVGSQADLDRDMEYESFGDWVQAMANSAITGQWGGSRADIAKAAIDAEKARAADRGDEARDTDKNKASRSKQADKDRFGFGALDAEDKQENKPGGDDVNPDTGKTTDQELTDDWEDDPDALF